MSNAVSDDFWDGFCDGYLRAAEVTSPIWAIMFLCGGVIDGRPIGVPLAIAWGLILARAVRRRASSQVFGTMRFSRQRTPSPPSTRSPAMTFKFSAAGLTGAEHDVLWCLFLHGPTWDGNIPSKVGRSNLVENGYAERRDGWNWLTFEGVTLALDMGMGKKKEARP